MKIQALLSAACVLLTAVPSALAEEQSHAVAKPIEAFEDVLVSAGLYDPEDEDSEDMGDFVAKKDNNKKSNKKKSKKSNRRRRKSRNNRRRRNRSYRNGMCRNPKRSDRDLCDELEKDFCDSRRDFRQNERLCKNLGFRRSVTDEEWSLMAETVEEYLPEEYEMLIDEVANNLESSEDSEDLYDSEDEEDEDSEDEDSEDMGDFVAKKDDSKKESNKKKPKKSNKKNSKKSSKRRRSSCDDRSKKSCKDKRSCEWVDWKKGKSYCRREYTDESSDYDFESASEDFYSEY